MVVYMIKEKKETSKFHFHYLFLIVAFVTFIAYLIIELLHYDSFLNFLPRLLGSILILLFLVCFIIISTKNKKQHSIVIVGSILIILYSVINILLTTKIISFPTDEYVPNFYNQNSLILNEWKLSNNVNVIENYEYSDIIKKGYIISQNIMPPTLTKNIKEIEVTISLGPDLEKEVIVPNFVGLKFDEVLKYIENNYLNNVIIEFQKSEKESDTVISQTKSGTMKRSDEITIVFAKSSEDFGEIRIIDFTNKSKLYATSWLKKYNFKYEIKEDYSDDVKEGLVITQSAKDEVKNPETDTIILTISIGKRILAPDIKNMSIEEINKWAIENNVKISYKEEYNDEVKLGDVINTSIEKNGEITNDKKIEITISKGKLEMIKLTSINEFTNWAENNNIDYQINYENSETVKKDDIIKCSHNTGQLIKKDDTVIVTVSKGKTITIPNFVGMNKSDIQNKCNNINLNCTFKTGGYTENTKTGIAISQSKPKDTKVSEGTSLIITLSAGIQEKVNVPNFVGKNKSTISSECNKIGIKCSFTYQSGYRNETKDTCISQSKTGTVNKGSSITITLSNGPAKTYTIVIQADWLSWGNPQATKATLESKLKANCPGVNFKFSYEKVNSGIGYLSSNSQVKVGSNNLTQGKTYNVIINSN